MDITKLKVKFYIYLVILPQIIDLLHPLKLGKEVLQVSGIRIFRNEYLMQ
jgi:hypothetical protein